MMKKSLVLLAALTAFGAAQAQVGTAAKEAGAAAVEKTEQAGQSVAGAVTTGPTSAVHKAKAKQHTKKAKAAMDQANKNAPPPPAVGEKAN